MIFIVIGAGMAIAMYLLSKILSPSSPDAEKLSAYECGFEAFDDARSKFDVKFYNFFTLKYLKIMCKTNASFLSSLNTYCFL